ncbi:uncharacterized protein EV154DRAFT_503773 [Mucor mucedo]|uniref:uncharacterized protein n=1 Tax=Mucor mucedo TaxID=29922 RepID=UPI00221F3A9E|nr:uncharacterized protein EV154DRAFT_503773 [Mucor mucedo]KAI7892852.1 hypothetical protein EV154DRAFT_503773 [Mucor mucedo]
MSSTSISLLCEASEDELFTFYKKYFEITHVRYWKVLDLFQALLVEYKPISYDCTSIFVRTFKKFALNYTSSNVKLQHNMKNLLNKCENVINSNLARTLVMKERVEQSRLLYCTHVADDVLKDKTSAINQNIVHPATSPLPNQISSLEVTPQSSTVAVTTSTTSNISSTPKRVNNNNPPPSSQNKRRKRLSASFVKGLSLGEKLQCLADSYGNDNTLDLVSPGTIPARFKSIIKRISVDLQIPLSLKYTRSERAILVKVIKATSLHDVEVIVKDIPLVPRVGLQSYIYIALSKLLLLYQCNQLRDNTHKEGWYQGHLYADVFDAVFLFDPFYVTKRTECHATTIKYLKKIKQIAKDEKDIKVDLILFNEQLGDIFSCEDKPADATEADVEIDLKKAKDLREKRLVYIKSILPHPSLINTVEVMSAQFHGLTLTIYGSRMTESGIIVHYKKGVASLPAVFSMPEVAHFLLTVMSLQRAIVLDLRKLTAIYQVGLEDSISFLASNNSDIFYRADSPISDGTSDTSADSDMMETERLHRILKLAVDKVSAIELDDDLLSCEDWEDLLVIDKNDG